LLSYLPQAHKKLSIVQTQAALFDEILQTRRSIRKFDTETPVPDEVIQRSLERAILAPNSSNMQLWQFIWVRSEDKRKQLVPLCMGQNAAKTAAHLVVFLTRRAWWRNHARWNLQQAESDPQNAAHPKRLELMRKYYGQLMPLAYRSDPFGFFTLVRFLTTFLTGLFRPMARLGSASEQRVRLHKSCALAAQNFMLSITAEGYATCPMEGFDRVRVHKALGLPRDAEICMIVAVGKGTEAGIYGERRRLPLDGVLQIV
jgi:nitroreductase